MSQKLAPLEGQIKTLASCGIILRDDLTIEHLLAMFYREAYENDPYRLLLTVMGGELANLNKNTGLNFEWLT